jgi:hypothetical protein
VTDSVRELFRAYAEYIGCDVEELDTDPLDVWDCDDCDVTIPVSASDPQAYGPVLCPECGELCEVRDD